MERPWSLSKDVRAPIPEEKRVHSCLFYQTDEKRRIRDIVSIACGALNSLVKTCCLIFKLAIVQLIKPFVYISLRMYSRYSLNTNENRQIINNLSLDAAPKKHIFNNFFTKRQPTLNFHENLNLRFNFTKAVFVRVDICWLPPLKYVLIFFSPLIDV